MHKEHIAHGYSGKSFTVKMGFIDAATKLRRLTVMTEVKSSYKLDLERVPIAAEADCC